MGKPLIMVSSITYAMKARDLLINNGIAAYEAENLLRTHGIKIVGRTDWEEST